MPLHVDIANEQLVPDPGLLSRAIRLAVEGVDSFPDGDWTVTVLIAESEEIIRLHAEFFSDPSDTDVMSFPSGEIISEHGGYLGDIAISLNQASSQAAGAGHSLNREIVYLALHGLLHLVGMDDHDAHEQSAMLALQDALLANAESRIGRGL